MKLPRSYLFVPGDRPGRFEKAHTSGADAIIIDLEDAVSPDQKDLARTAAASWISAATPAYVRINASDTAWFEDDVATFAQNPGVIGIVVPKAADSETLLAVARNAHARLSILPLIETVAGFDAISDISAAPRVERLMFGTVDFQVDTGIEGDGEELSYFRLMMTLGSRRSGLGAPVDGVTVDVDDEVKITNDTLRAKRFGFRAKLCIHPRQISAIHAALSPTTKELEWAQLVVQSAAQSNGAAFSVEGKMVDAPVIEQAKRVLRMVDR